MSIATELTALSGHITNAYNAVNTKGGTIPANKNMANLDDAILSIPSGGQITNGTVVQYKASSTTVPADTFFEFTDGPITSGITAGAITVGESNSGGAKMTTAKLDSSRLCASYTLASDLVVAVRSVDSSGVITYGTPATVEEVVSGVISQIAVVDSNTFVVVYNTTAGTNDGYTKAAVCTVNGLSVSVGTPIQVSSGFHYGTDAPAIAATGANSVMILSYVGNTLSGNIFTISGNTLTASGTETVISISGTNYDLGRRPIAALGDNKFIVAMGYSSGTCYGCVVSVSGTTITVGDSVQLAGPFYVRDGFYDILPLSSTSAFLLYRYDSSDYSYVAGQVLSVSGMTLTHGSYSTIGSRDAGFIGAAVVDTNKVLCLYGSVNSNHYGKICTINGTSFTSSSAVTLSSVGSAGATAFLGGLTAMSNSLAIGFTTDSNSSIARGFAIVGPRVIQASQTRIDGVTIDDITSSTAGDVWVLDQGS